MTGILDTPTVSNKTRAWRLSQPGAALELLNVEIPFVRAGSVLVRMEATRF